MSSKQILFLSIFTFFTIVAWIVFDIHHVLTTSTVSPVREKLIKPLEPKFDHQVILELKKGVGP